MLDLGWKNKAERLRAVIVSAAHQIAKELPPGTVAILDLFRRTARTGDGSNLKAAFDQICVAHANEQPPLWEPVDIYGWKIQATLYLQNGQHWWLLNAVRRNEKEPSTKDVAVLDKVLGHLGADPKRDMIIGPLSSPDGEPLMVFGWWTWFNRWPLFEVQVNKAKRGQDAMRIVPHGTRASDGYQAVDLRDDGGDDKDRDKP